ncbi:TIGR00730 family Rossman fold protein [Subtercola boreus]|uniref:Cytokinin riboside 5'-monophosphate phosphoribohydrolase n=1 Tax=Subtercola boreus TaxID=120213 RepID=A0A3E0WAI1_9MICO|nr:TIGR00730 family Rossman fold protein [Subtercola boreus]RFA21016.1 Rossman fold protein, TIGR00730 family [Subtercola boreus]RFA21400.1 Rossman fold protein, TIGR00730 family [Subtercola boreus]RFA27371.1 Rossman fold protein, TIGR00730 family [Subtercola boreus]
MTSTDRPFTVAVFCGSSTGNDPVYVDAARTVGETLALQGIAVVYGGGHVGLMGAVADAALDAGGHVTGVIPQALHDREIIHDTVSELVIVETMHERKMVMAERSDAFLALPGGPGTLEEITEQWTWAQLGIHEKPCGFLNVAGYYDPLITLVETMRDRGFTHPRYTAMLRFSDSIDELVAAFRSYTPPMRVAASPGLEMSELQTVRP